MAIERVEKLLNDVVQALNQHGIQYAVIGGNAVAAWISTVDESAVRFTKDVDILIRRESFDAAAKALFTIGLMPVEVLGVCMFVDREHPNPKTGVHVVFAGERIMAHYMHAAPDPALSIQLRQGVHYLDLVPLLTMKLQANRNVDRTHIDDMLDVGLISDEVKSKLPDDLRQRLDDIRADWDKGMKGH